MASAMASQGRPTITAIGPTSISPRMAKMGHAHMHWELKIWQKPAFRAEQSLLTCWPLKGRNEIGSATTDFGGQWTPLHATFAPALSRSDERSVGTAGVSTCRSMGSALYK